MYAALQILNKEGLFTGVLSERVLQLHFLTQVLICFVVVFAVMCVMTIAKPNQTPKTLPVREDMERRRNQSSNGVLHCLSLCDRMFLYFREAAVLSLVGAFVDCPAPSPTVSKRRSYAARDASMPYK